MYSAFRKNIRRNIGKMMKRKEKRNHKNLKTDKRKYIKTITAKRKYIILKDLVREAFRGLQKRETG